MTSADENVIPSENSTPGRNLSAQVRPSGEVVLIDFGLSRHRELPDLMAEEFRLPYGTAPYMAPEQVVGVRELASNAVDADQCSLRKAGDESYDGIRANQSIE